MHRLLGLTPRPPIHQTAYRTKGAPAMRTDSWG
jgi:hypothetical protein